MSVYKSKRGESSAQFVETARKLEVHTLAQCLKIPKRYTFFLSTEIMRLASEVYNNVKSANSIFPSNQHEVQMRRDKLTEANNALQCLVGKACSGTCCGRTPASLRDSITPLKPGAI